jgi:prefoldin subunit 5
LKINELAVGLNTVEDERDSLQNDVECLELEITELKTTKKELEVGIKEVEN